MTEEKFLEIKDRFINEIKIKGVNVQENIFRSDGELEKVVITFSDLVNSKRIRYYTSDTTLVELTLFRHNYQKDGIDININYEKERHIYDGHRDYVSRREHKHKVKIGENLNDLITSIHLYVLNKFSINYCLGNLSELKKVLSAHDSNRTEEFKIAEYSEFKEFLKTMDRELKINSIVLP